MVNNKSMKALHRARGSLKHRLATIKNFLNETETNIIGNNGQLPFDMLSLVNARINCAQEVFDAFQETQNQIEQACDDDKLEFEFQERESFEEEHINIICKLQTIASNCEHSVNALQLSSQPAHQNKNIQINNDIQTFQTDSVKLPIINLPKFSGIHTEWMEFKETFESLIHSNKAISNVQKFHYMRASLIGSAAKVIQKISLSSENYDTAWDILCSRYNNKDLLIHNHIKAIFDLPHTTSGDSKTFRNMCDEVSRNLGYLSKLGEPEQQRDAILIFIISSKFDKYTAKEWEDFISTKSETSLANLELFLNSRGDICEKLEQRNISSKPNYKTEKRQTFVATQHLCLMCKAEHALYRCPAFLKLTPQQRFERVKSFKICHNCLNEGHATPNCFSGRCRVCNKSHNTLLHFELEQQVALTSKITNSSMQVILSTIMVAVVDINGKEHQARALLDCGSQSNYATYSFIKKLGIRCNNTNIAITGISQVTANIKHKCEFTIHSNYSNFKTKINCLLLNCISDKLPDKYLDIHITELKNIQLADPSYNEPGSIDILIGAGLFWQILQNEKIHLGINKPQLQNTVFGWIVTGNYDSRQPSVSVCNFSKFGDLHEQLENFWKVEDDQVNDDSYSISDQLVEKHFNETFKRSPQGRFIVEIPFKESPTRLGNSRKTALKRFYNLEKRLNADKNLKAQYSDFMSEYERLGHMTKLSEILDDTCFYLPHHAIIKEDHITTKCRVVFDASAVTDTGLSLNNIQYSGPVVQQDLTTILIRFRQHAYVVSADISKMYRQVQVTPAQRKYQRIFWRPDPKQELGIFELNTVTFGTASGPYLATRCLKQLAIENRELNPEASKIIERDFYVDDLLTGSDSAQNTQLLCKQISEILVSGGFELTKWCSNDSSILQYMNQATHLTSFVKFDEKPETKLLGLQWYYKDDSFTYHINNCLTNTITKRTILSDISKIFDPLGLLSPSIIITKIILQQLWLQKINWDDEVPYNLREKWLHFYNNLKVLNSLKIQRCVTNKYVKIIELHGFCDASQEAYGACVYVRTIDTSGNVKVHLLFAKSRVAPLKVLSIPRLELCGALVLVNIMNKVNSAVTFEAKNYYWTDSQVVLCWLKNQSRQFQTFVANRISKIQTSTDIDNWKHIRSEQNPADLISRGVQPDELLHSELWWKGPPFLMQNEQLWPKIQPLELSDLPETKNTHLYFSTHTDESFMQRFSSLTKLMRTTALCLRFIRNCKLRRVDRKGGALSSSELEQSLTTLIKLSQKLNFNDEINILSSAKELPLKNKLKGLNPFLDMRGLLRVGGRLSQANLAFDQTHPILLSSKCYLSKLIFNFEHLRLCHAGQQLLLYTTRQKYWILGGRNLARKVVHSCITCIRAKPTFQVPLMGNLPTSRVQPTLPFLKTGTDFAGPFYVKERRGRGQKLYKCYVCVFVCMATKAVHLETVTNLTSASFLELLRRFIARRGHPAEMYSDNGTTYIGANSELHEIGNFIQNSSKDLHMAASRRGIRWNFIPAYSPNFGGIWEAGVKSFKHHLKRVLTNSSVTFEEFTTIIIEIEGILNSRPLYAMSSDPSDFQPLSPAHFLIGRTLTAIIEPDVRLTRSNRLSHFQQMQQIKQHFWERWSKEYISELQRRSKWTTNMHNIQINSLVIIKEDNIPPLRWKLGRVVEVHPGLDGVVRVVSVKNLSGTKKRAVSRLCVLPIEPEI